MSRHAFSQLYFHIVWSTTKRLPLIKGHFKDILHSAIEAAGRRQNSHVIAVNSHVDHIHVLIRTDPEIQLSNLIRNLKGYSSFVMNGTYQPLPKFKWQRGYYIRTVSPQELEKVSSYIRFQELHHRAPINFTKGSR